MIYFVSSERDGFDGSYLFEVFDGDAEVGEDGFLTDG